TMGPVVGGILLGTLGWRWVFWVAAPLALAGAVIGWLVIPQTADHKSERKFDWRGAVLLMPALAMLLIVISLSHAWGPTSPEIIGSAVVTVTLLTMFIGQERRVSASLIDLDLFRITAFAGGIVAIVVSYAMLYGMFFLMSFALVRGYHHSPLAAGLRLAVIPVALGIVAPFSGTLYERLGVRTVLLSGMAVCCAALILLSVSLTGTSNSVHSLTISLAVFGAGLGMFIAPNNSATLSAAPSDRSGEAGGLLNLMRIFGMSVGVACASGLAPIQRDEGALVAASGGDRDWRPHASCVGRRLTRRGKRRASATGRVCRHCRCHIGASRATTRSRGKSRRLIERSLKFVDRPRPF